MRVETNMAKFVFRIGGIGGLLVDLSSYPECSIHFVLKKKIERGTSGARARRMTGGPWSAAIPVVLRQRQIPHWQARQHCAPLLTLS